jgi:hypothetical protein
MSGFWQAVIVFILVAGNISAGLAQGIVDPLTSYEGAITAINAIHTQQGASLSAQGTQRIQDAARVPLKASQAEDTDQSEPSSLASNTPRSPSKNAVQSLERRVASTPKLGQAGTSLVATAAMMPPGTWYELPHTRFADAYPAKGSVEWGVVGPASVLIAWNNLAFDGVCLYAHGGGHTDYGGNEVYRFCFDTLKWQRITEPSLYPTRVSDRSAPVEQRCPHPVSGPPSMHTYDGKVFSPLTHTMFMWPNIAFCPSGLGERGGFGLWEFNPSETKSRNGLAPLTWRQVLDNPGPSGRTAMLPDGKIAIGDGERDALFDPITHAITNLKINHYGNEGDGSSIFDPARSRVWMLTRVGLRYADYVNGQLGDRVDFLRTLPGGVHFASAMAFHPPTKQLFFWSGQAQIVTFAPSVGDPKQGWHICEPQSGPSSTNALYDKLFWLDDYGVFASLQNPNQGVWLYKPAIQPCAPLTAAQLQDFIDKAPDGSTIKLPPGVYSKGFKITNRKNLTIDMTGVRPLSVVDSKALVLIENSTGITIENAQLNGAFNGENLAALRADGVFDIVLRRAHFFNNDTCVLTGNVGGTLLIEDSTLEDCGGDSGQSHVVYFGQGQKLTIRNSTLTRPRGLGHILKSRANRTIVENSQIYMGPGHGSRAIDLPAGGDNVIRNSIIEQGPNADNADIMAFAMEQNAKQWREQRTLLEGNLIISDVMKRPGTGGTPITIAFCKGGHQIHIRNNRFVWANELSLKGQYMPSCSPAESTENMEFIGRSAAGLPPYPALPTQVTR